MTRREFPSKVKAAAFERANGQCEDCGARLYPGKFRYDHDLPDWLGGEPTLENCKVRCSNCNGEKTYTEDIPRIAKTKRQRNRHIGAKTRKGRPMPGTKASGWKRKIDGTVERRS